MSYEPGTLSSTSLRDKIRGSGWAEPQTGQGTVMMVIAGSTMEGLMPAKRWLPASPLRAGLRPVTYVAGACLPPWHGTRSVGSRGVHVGLSGEANTLRPIKEGSTGEFVCS